MSRVVFTFFLIVGCILSGRSQLTIERSVVSSFALNGTACGLEIFSTGGQVGYTLLDNGTEYVAVGFEQPWDKIPLMVYYKVVLNSCSFKYEITVDSVVGCSTLQSSRVRWSGAYGNAHFETDGPFVLLEIFGPPDCYFSKEIDVANEWSSEKKCELLFYNYISPNADEKNDRWVIEHIDQPLYAVNSVRIMNRWGQEVWGVSNYDNTSHYWDGLDAEQNTLPDGTYFYIVEANNEKYSGYIELQR